ncbi:MAG: haloacid dehalogenase type II, partial [Chloroflexi bacterium]|nr:haloacid dehalogenase type II [Chloroflexota bacterium]
MFIPIICVRPRLRVSARSHIYGAAHSILVQRGHRMRPAANSSHTRPRSTCGAASIRPHPGVCLRREGGNSMETGRRRFVKTVGAAAGALPVAGAGLAAAAATQGPGRAGAEPFAYDFLDPRRHQVAPAPLAQARAEGIEAFAFDAYGTLFDVFSVTALCEELFPGDGDALAQRWRAKQLQYSLLRSLMGRHRDFWLVTGDALVNAAAGLGLDLTPARRDRLMEAYLTLAAFPDVRPGLAALRDRGVKLAILSNGEPRMLEAAARSAGIDTLLDTIISVEEVKIFKVSPRVYNLGPERLGVDRSALGFVSSNAWDVAGAASAGLTTFWIQRTEGEPPEEL